MTAIDTRTAPDVLRVAAAMHSIAVAGDGLTRAKHTRLVAAIERAQLDLQCAVDAARDLDVGWGEIGSALGIARGNAYQRFRRKPLTRAAGGCLPPAL